MRKLFRDLKVGDDFWRVSINNFGNVSIANMHITNIIKDNSYVMFCCQIYQFPDFQIIGTGYIHPIMDCSVDGETYPGWTVCTEKDDVITRLKELIENLPKSIILSIECLNRLESL